MLCFYGEIKKKKKKISSSAMKIVAHIAHPHSPGWASAAYWSKSSNFKCVVYKK